MNEDMPLSKLIDLSGKVAIVTGGARGIGFSISRHLAEAGASVLIADIDGDEAKESARRILDCGYQAISAFCDVSDEVSVRDMVSFAVERLGQIDILVNNAGIYPRKSFLEMTLADFERVMAVNLAGAFLCTLYASRKMVERRCGCIINIASIEALHPSSTGMSAYDASKGGLLMLTKSMAKELGIYGVRVNAIAPGAIATHGVFSQFKKELSQEEEKAQLKELKSFLARIALGRMGEVDEVARVALFLASEMASYITGEVVVVDGGYLTG